MRRTLLPLLSASGILAISMLVPPLAQAEPAKMGAAMAAAPASVGWNTPLQGQQQIVHVLNRLTFGPRSGDVQAVQRMGLSKWIEAQLHPETIDDQAVEAKLASFKFLNSDAATLQLVYEGDNGAIARFLRNQRQNAGLGKAKNTAQVPAATLTATQDQAMTTPAAMDAPAPQPAVKERRKAVLNVRQQQTLQAFEDAGMLRGDSMRAIGELSTAKIVRAVESNRQLQEVLVDFWSNHFNVDTHKNTVRVLKILDDRETIRPHVFGSFRELLGASAKSPAMLVYLDNFRSTASVTNRNGKTRGGLNENYARELMELHTLGVDGGYSQQDVTEVARCLTGWGIDQRGADGPRFQFRPQAHDKGAKTVLGRTIPAGGGQQDGETVLDILASSPATAKFIANKLCLRFVSDNPPPQLVERVAQAFLKSKGDLPTIYRTLFTSPEFTSQAAYRAKIKSPFEYTVSAVRALNGTIIVPNAEQRPRERQRLVLAGTASAGNGNRGANAQQRSLPVEIANMGQPLFGCQPPTGYSEVSTNWVSSSALVSRLNFAIDLTSGKMSDVLLGAQNFEPASIDQLTEQIVGGEISPATRQTITTESQKAGESPAQLRALLLGSPEFQRR